MAKKIALLFIAACAVGDKTYNVGDTDSFEADVAAELIKKEMAEEVKTEKKDTEEKTVKVRMLVAHRLEDDDQSMPCNSVQTVPVSVAKQWVAQGIADDNAAAVKYAESVAREEAAEEKRLSKK